MTILIPKKLAAIFMALSTSGLSLLPAQEQEQEQPQPQVIRIAVPPGTDPSDPTFIEKFMKTLKVPMTPPGTMPPGHPVPSQGGGQRSMLQVQAPPSNVEEMTFREMLEEGMSVNQALNTAEFIQDRRVYLSGEINEATIDEAIEKIKILDRLKPGAPIKLVIDSQGGSVLDGFRLINLFDTLPNKSPIHTVGETLCASMGAAILIAGHHREAMPNCRILVHEARTPRQASAGGGIDKMDDVEARLDMLRSLNDQMLALIAAKTGIGMQDMRRIAKGPDTGYSAEDAVTLGFIHKIVDIGPQTNPAPGSRRVPEHLFPDQRGFDYYRRRALEGVPPASSTAAIPPPPPVPALPAPKGP